MDIDNLISEIFIRSPLWYYKNKNHHNRFVLDKLWDKVAVKLNTKRKYNGNFPRTSDDIVDESSQTLQGESDEDDVSEQSVTDNVQSPLDHLEHLDSATSSVTPSSSRASSSARNYPKKRLTKEDIGQALLQVEKQKLKFIEQKKNKNEEDEDLNFFQSLLPHV
ncbi:uncharacterized protein [Diabrotica undecimpunctata]|uniref:uncharacterized protein n=1 Tax=Diabrotica undecimpunctata TaxID=50387 RepID=UPI003B641A95